MTSTLGREGIRVSVAHYYRLRSFKQLVSGQRALLYTAFGYAIASQHHVPLLIINTLIMGLLFMFFGAYDNYTDWRLLGEHNGTSRTIEAWGLSRVTGLLLVFVPWVGIAPLLSLARHWGLSLTSERLFWLMTILGFAYMTPGVRLKGRPFDFLIAPLWACLLFLQAYTLTQGGTWSAAVLLLCGTVFALQCEAEWLHRLDDGHHHARGAARAGSRPQCLVRLRWLPVVMFGVSLVAASVSPLFLNTAVWSIVRFVALRRMRLEQVARIRRQLWHPVWSLYEFALYALWGVFHIFGVLG